MSYICIDNVCVICVKIGFEFDVFNWVVEVLLCMLMNNFDLDVVEKFEEFVVYGGIGCVVCDWESFDCIVFILKCFKEDEILLVQFGKLVGVFCIYKDVLCVLLVNFNLVLNWVIWEYFCEFDQKGLMMYGQMMAGLWIYIGF